MRDLRIHGAFPANQAAQRGVFWKDFELRPYTCRLACRRTP